jgi:hypothetical protein
VALSFEADVEQLLAKKDQMENLLSEMGKFKDLVVSGFNESILKTSL